MIKSLKPKQHNNKYYHQHGDFFEEIEIFKFKQFRLMKCRYYKPIIISFFRIITKIT